VLDLEEEKAFVTVLCTVRAGSAAYTTGQDEGKRRREKTRI